MSTRKTPGSDAIPAEVYNAGGITLFQPMWEKKKLPQNFRDATIAHIYKRKENRLPCSNYHRISLLSIASKVLARALLNCQLHHLEWGLLPESQCGFCAG